MASAPSITKDPDATIKFLKNIIDKNNEFLDETDYLAEVWGDDYEGQEYSLLKQYRKLKKQNALGQNKQQNMGQAENKLGNLLPAEPGYAHVIDTRNNEIVEMAQDDIERAIESGQYKRLP